MTRTVEETLRTAKLHFDVLARYQAIESDEQMVHDAICMRLSAGIEALSTLDSRDITRLFGDQWADMWGMRNRIAHGYLTVSSRVVQGTVADDVPTIISVIKAELAV